MPFSRQLQDLWNRFIVPIDDPGSRLFHINILASVVLILLFVFFSQRGKPWRELLVSAKKLMFRKSYWWNSSTRVDYQVYILNALLKVFLFIPLLQFSYFFSKIIVKALVGYHGGFLSLEPTTLNLLAVTAFAFVWDDFLRFFHHWLMHQNSWLWSYHKMHHSARVLTPMTLYRIHPMESAMATVRNSLSLGVSIGLFIFIFEAQFSLITLFGVNLFGSLFNFLGANLRHSHIPLSFGFMDKVFISPKQHQLHHSRDPKHFNSNYGVSLALWDHLFGSFKSSRFEKPFKFGLDERHNSSLIHHVSLPFRENAKLIIKASTPLRNAWTHKVKAYCKQPASQLKEEEA